MRTHDDALDAYDFASIYDGRSSSKDWTLGDTSSLSVTCEEARWISASLFVNLVDYKIVSNGWIESKLRVSARAEQAQ